MAKTKTATRTKLMTVCGALGVICIIAGCTPTVKVEAPDKPIHLKIDVNIKQEVLLKVEQDVDDISVTPAIPLAKRAGWIGERLDGYLGLVRADAPDDIRNLVFKANEGRRQGYVDIAGKHNVEVTMIETVAGRRFIDRSGSGEFVQTEDESWVQK